MAKGQGIQGTVIVDAIISTDGTVKNPHVISSPSPLLSNAGIDAVSKWRYAPSKVNGVPVEGEVMISVIFTLGDPSLRPPSFLR
jgi:protein TonB